MSSSGRLAGKVALIAGGTSGIGRAGAERFSQEGAQVVVASPQREEGQRFATELNQERPDSALYLETDVSRPEDVRRMVEASEAQFGRLDVLWANAGIAGGGTAPDTSHELWERVIAVNLGGVFNVAKYGIPALVRAGGGSLIFTASEFGLVGASSSVAYCAAKGGVVNMTRAIAVDCGPLKIRVNCICPGPIWTPLLKSEFAAAADPAAVEAAQVRPLLLGRIGEADEIANAAVFLASDESSFMTGSIMVVDGGATAWYGF
jgi:NAD(P)-dependent dehydrogenase (short-subunit alcohol dehydrogenase family)